MDPFWKEYHFSGAQLGGRDGGEAPQPFFENQKKALILEKKGPNCVHSWVESSIQNVVLRVSWRKSYKILPCRAFFLVFLTKGLLKCPNFTSPESFLVARLLLHTCLLNQWANCESYAASDGMFEGKEKISYWKKILERSSYPQL